MGQGMSMGNIFYPDSPKRRARAEEIYNQIKVFEQEFRTLKATRIYTPEDLEREVRNNITTSADV
ncbi:hypothetical protein N7470_008813 [Penicillium chermesinum]|nr:hypothetical protein N7470_008813 [Penicillium chermesinum]